VIITCHDVYKGRQAIRQLRTETDCEEKNIRLMECDLCSIDSVRQFAKLYNNEEERLDVLICNASLLWTKNVVTKDGFNSVIQVNYLSQFLLTNLLLNKLKQCHPSRIINVSSNAHQSSNFESLKYILCFYILYSCSNDRLVGCIDTI
jgi:NAD(P)-dependent dehydrogenase (short-subunit alcohol dehydrogenase family)